ncbi:M20/M25/M40 family metallo-hydrolase [Gillisia sp. M10.2A]|uniref:M20/M25/M40 family metallo-hydrolase n=1 Tax=Gillisia lutea TaxID=2909668 RepID=A0ABS9EK37_9FLAO|nr:M20/M25/M40 family metallo-hydrolase [Gillisia lutea]MCF4102224.1 M20/M25/M40 family metallo-hydrolase [Gillisia lutea]
MSKFLFKISVLASLAIFISCNSSQTAVSEKVIISESYNSVPEIQTSVASIKRNMEYLASDDLRGRETGTDGIDKAASYIEKFFTDNNIQPYFETYRDSFEVKNVVGYNVVGMLEGNDPVLKKEFVIIGAHYDHIGIGKVVDNDSIANGANDDAAGTVAVLELAKELSRLKSNRRSVLFTLFSAEEMGLMGSKHLSKRLKEAGLDLYAMFNIEMIGVPMVNKDYQVYITGYEESNLADKFNEYSKEKVLGFLPQAKEYNLFMRSDNYPFYQEFKVPAQTISSFDFTNFDYYHHVGDEASKMNMEHMATTVNKVFPGIYAMLNTSEKEIKLND